MKNTFLILLVLTRAVTLSGQANEIAASESKISVYFDFNKDVPTSASAATLEKWISENHTSEILALRGYCDSTDANSYNKKLSERRILSVRDILQSNDIRIKLPLRINALGEEFVQSEDNAKNRRVDILYRKSFNYKLENDGKDGLSALVKEQFRKAKKGDLIQIHNINFYLNSEKVITESQPVLESLYSVLLETPDLKIEIHGHICCNPNTTDTSLSYRRAKFIFTYLLEKGIPLNRLGYKGFGSSRPLYPIPEKNDDQAEANRRVEIEITENR